MTFGFVGLVIASTTPDSPEARIRKWDLRIVIAKEPKATAAISYPSKVEPVPVPKRFTMRVPCISLQLHRQFSKTSNLS